MKTHDCQLADRSSLAIGSDVRARMHERCPGAYRTPDGAAHPCECRCHAGQTEPHDVALPVLVPPAGDRPGRPRSDRKKVEKGSPRACLCGCGSPVSRRFLPGHDAKLKSQLRREVRSPDLAVRTDARARLAELGWD